VRSSGNLGAPPSAKARVHQLRVTELLREINEFLARQPRHVVVTDSGDMLFAGLDLRVPLSGGYLAQGFYASMGFSVPAALGAQIGGAPRPLVLCGDGAFQMTGPELSHATKLGLNPIVIVVNNGGWGIFRPVADRQELLEVPPWPYAKLAEDWGGLGLVANCSEELREALEKADAHKGFSLIEARIAHDDLSPMSVKYIREAARRSRAPSVDSAAHPGQGRCVSARRQIG
jgi:TPP-dependent 2-oxoacid decarboxylase